MSIAMIYCGWRFTEHPMTRDTNPGKAAGPVTRYPTSALNGRSEGALLSLGHRAAKGGDEPTVTDAAPQGNGGFQTDLTARRSGKRARINRPRP